MALNSGICHPCRASCDAGVQKSLGGSAAADFSGSSEKPQDIRLENHYLAY